MVVAAVHSQLLRPSGASHAVPCLLAIPPSSWLASRGNFVTQLVTARDDTLSVYEVWRKSGVGGSSSKGVTGNITASEGSDGQKYCLYHARTHQLSGSVTGLCRVRTMSSRDDGCDRLLVSFKEAKMALMEWSISSADLATVSIHTYERAPQLASGLPHLFLPLLRADPEHRCAALLLPNDALALLPLCQDTSELDLFDGEGTANSEAALPYQPSFVIALNDIDKRLGNVRDFTFLHGFQKPTLAVLFTEQLTWTSLLHEKQDTCTLFLVTLDPAAPSHPVIASRSGLPYDCLYVTACPTSLGGVLVATPSAVMHIAQNGNIIGTTADSWYDHTSKLELPLREGAEALSSKQAFFGPTTYAAPRRDCLDLQNSHICFPSKSETAALLCLKDGSFCVVQFGLDGRIISKLDLRSLQTSAQFEVHPPSLICSHPDPQGLEIIFCGSIVGDSTLAVLKPSGEVIDSTDASNRNNVAIEDDQDVDMDDLYGPSDLLSTTADKSRNAFDLATMCLAPSDYLSSVGPVTGVTLAILQEQDAMVPYLAACTGSCRSGALTLIEPHLTLRKKRRLEVSSPTAFWSIPDQRLTITDTEEGSLLSEIDQFGSAVHRNLGERSKTIAVGGSNDRSCFIRVTAHGLERLSLIGQRTALLQTDFSVNAASVAGGLVATLDDNTLLRVFACGPVAFSQTALHSDLSEGNFTFVRLVKDVYNINLPAHVQSLQAASLNGVSLSKASNKMDDDEEIDYGDEEEMSLGPVVPDAPSTAAANAHLLFVSRVGEQAEIWSLSDTQELLWSSNLVSLAPPRLGGVYPDSSKEGLEEVTPVQTMLSDIGGLLHLCIIYENGMLLAYEAVPGAVSASGKTRTLAFVKVFAEQLNPVATPGDSQPSYFLHPLDRPDSLSGLLVGGPVSGLLTKSTKGSLLFSTFDVGSITAFAELDSSPEATQILYKGNDEVYFCEIPRANVDLGLPVHQLARGRTRTEVAAHPPSRSIIASCVFETPFISYEIEDSSPARDPSVDPSNAVSYRGAIELFTDREGDPIDGYEFEPNEVASCIELVSLSSTTTESRRRDYVAVGTIISYGEDRAARGATYIFDVVEVVAPLNDAESKHRLKLICKDDCKAPITNIVDMNGYLILTMGMKMYARSLEQDEWLVTIAFLDLFSHTTSLRRLRNYLLLGDFQNSLYLVAFQEEPFRLVMLGKDFKPASLTSANFMVNGSSLALVGTTLDGVIRALEYGPSVPTSQGGQKLLMRTEYQCASLASCSAVLSGALTEEGGPSVRSDIVYGMTNGSIETVVPMEEAPFRILYLLQTQLMRSVQHVAGLNPRGFRTVRNTSTSRPLTKGLLDGALLRRFLSLPFARMADLVRNLPTVGRAQVGVEEVLEALEGSRIGWGSARG